jgi:hypothetical protein
MAGPMHHQSINMRQPRERKLLRGGGLPAGKGSTSKGFTWPSKPVVNSEEDVGREGFCSSEAALLKQNIPTPTAGHPRTSAIILCIYIRYIAYQYIDKAMKGP